MAKKTLIIGASTDPSRYSFLAANKLVSHKHEIELLGIKEGIVAGKEINTEKDKFENIDTVTLYVNPQRQREYFDYVANLNPRRVIFNPGTENPAFEDFLTEKGIEPIEACTLVMLATGQY
jgi:predicted CoA-binding protein|nr:CoA-binding protein [uncultured Emticicia sp.]